MNFEFWSNYLNSLVIFTSPKWKTDKK